MENCWTLVDSGIVFYVDYDSHTSKQTMIPEYMFKMIVMLQVAASGIFETKFQINEKCLTLCKMSHGVSGKEETD